jgi:hypothetical protein
VVGRASGKHVSLPSDACHRHETHVGDRPDVGAVKVSASRRFSEASRTLGLRPTHGVFPRTSVERNSDAAGPNAGRTPVIASWSAADGREIFVGRRVLVLRLGEQLTLGGRESQDFR